MSRLFSQPAAVYFPFELSWWLLFRACNIFRSECSGETSFSGAQVVPPSPALALINGDAANSPKQSAAAAGGDRRAHQTDGPGRKNVIARKRRWREERENFTEPVGKRSN